VKKLIPVTFAPGLAMLVTRPSLTGSWLTMQTRGIVVVAALAAKAKRQHRRGRKLLPVRRTLFQIDVLGQRSDIGDFATTAAFSYFLMNPK
jgi:hypothetical protein